MRIYFCEQAGGVEDIRRRRTGVGFNWFSLSEKCGADTVAALSDLDRSMLCVSGALRAESIHWSAVRYMRPVFELSSQGGKAIRSSVLVGGRMPAQS